MMPTDKPHHDSEATPAAERDPEAPGVPGFRTWPGVYLFVFGCFVAAVALLALFTRVFA